MSLYSDLQKIEISKAVVLLVEKMLPKGTYNKVLNINITMDVENFKTNHRIFKEIQLFFYAPRNYVFVGEPVKPINYKNPLIDNTEFIYHGYHDSCWTSSIEDIIRVKMKEVLTEIQNKKGNEKDYSTHISFGFDAINIYHGNIKVNEPNEKSVFTTEIISEYPKETLFLSKDFQTPLDKYSKGDSKLATEWSEILGFKSYKDFMKKFQNDEIFRNWFYF